MDNFLLQAIVDEVSPQLIGQRLSKVYQPNNTDLVLDFKSGPGKSLLISTDPERLSVYLGDRSIKEADRSAQLPAFAAQLRKSIGSSRLIGIEKLGDDRVIFLDFRTFDEDGLSHLRRLIISLIGRSADICLTENQLILASLRNRKVGAAYQPAPPAPDRLDPFLLPDETWTDLIAVSNGSVGTAGAKLLGFTRILARELEFLSNQAAPVSALRDLLARISEGGREPSIYSNVKLDALMAEPGLPNAEMVLSQMRLEHLESGLVTRFSSLSEATAHYFSILAKQRQFVARRQELVSQLRAQLKKQSSLRDKLERELAQCGKADEHQRSGELLLANLHQVVKSAEGFQVIDYFTSGEPLITIPTAQKGEAREAADHYFKAARKARHGIKAINERLPVVNTAIMRLEEGIRQVSKATNPEEIAAVQSGSDLAGKRKSGVAKRGGRKEERDRLPGVRRYRSSDGYEILIGRTDRDNDQLTLKVAKSFDLWFHAADYPGSHVVLRNPLRKTVAPASIREAAELAAKFSQAKSDAKVAVNYCERKFVTKPKGFAPGQVRLSSFKTILVEPREAGERLY